jgi:HK97 family phage prohead protease
MERKRFSLKIKSVDDTGTFTGLGAAYGNVDLGGDKIMPGAFTRTLAAGKQWPVLWQHDPTSPIGTAQVTDSREGLLVQGKLLLQDPTAQKAYLFLKAGIIKGMSIGFETLQSTMDGDVRQLTELKLWELSIVTFPMNQDATISSVKSLSLSDDEVQHHLKAIARHQKGMRMHLKCLLGDDDELDDDDDDFPADDPALLEDNDDESDPADEGMSKALLMELQTLATQAQDLATAYTTVGIRGMADEGKVLSRDEIEAEIKRYDRQIEVLERTERSKDLVTALAHCREQREMLVNYLKRIDSTDVF